MSDNGQEEKQIWSKEINKCPMCGSEQRFFESIGEEMKKVGVVDEKAHFFLDMKQGHFLNQTALAKVPIGKEFPGFAYNTDICLDCGCIYAVFMAKPIAKKTLAPAQIFTNRDQRRQGLKDGMTFKLPPNMNNPFVS